MWVLPLVKTLKPVLKALRKPSPFSTVPQFQEGVARALGSGMATLIASEPALANGAAGAAGLGKNAKQVTFSTLIWTGTAIVGQRWTTSDYRVCFLLVKTQRWL